MAALLKGRGFVTNGPLIEFTAGQSMPGDEIQLPPAGDSITFRSVLTSIAPIERFELVRNGKVIETAPITEDRRRAVFEEALSVTDRGWYSMRPIGATQAHRVESTRPQAPTI